MSIFINREKELDILENRYKSNRAEFLVIYGRRRIGKSALIDKFLEKKNIKGIRLLAREESKTLQLRRFKEELVKFFNDEILEKMEFKNWDSFFEYLSMKADKRFVIAIDEFPYLVKEDPSLPSILQDYWDRKLRNTKIFLILSGSNIGMMESLLGYKSPLYGRRTGQILLKQLSFDSVFRWIGNIEKSIEFYSVFGGTPAYLMEIDTNKDVYSNIKEKILREDSFIYRDVEFLMRQEVEEPRYYFSILLSISKGNNRIGLICNDTGLSKSIVNKYLSVLIDLHLVKREIPITESYKSKKGLYKITDNLVDFWFRFVYPNMEKIESGDIERVLNHEIKPHFNEFVGRKFEDIILNISKRLFPNFTKLGKWWHKDKEIDIVGLNEKTKEILFGECKWQSRVNAEKVVKELVEKIEDVKWYEGERKEYFVVFAKSFSKRIDEFEGRKVFCFDLRDVEKVLKRKV